jgi:hypothetical protein
MNAWRTLTCMLFGAVIAAGCASSTPTKMLPTNAPYDSCAEGDSCPCDQGYCTGGLSGGLLCEPTNLPASSGYTGSFCTSGCDNDYDCPIAEKYSNNFPVCVNGQCYLKCNPSPCPYGQSCFEASNVVGGTTIYVYVCTPPDK